MKSAIFIMITFIIVSCQDNTTEPTINLDFVKNQKVGLIVVVETNFELDQNSEIMFEFYKDEMLIILSDMFEVEKEEMKDMTMSEIVEVFGEDWQIESIQKIAEDHYNEIVVLSDQNCTGDILMNTISDFSMKGYFIDMVFSLHASSSKSISFIDRSYHINEFTDYLAKNSYNIRSLYQTCCFGKSFISNWKNSGMCAINGSVERNDINIFSPVYFFEEWILNKRSFNVAVELAFNREIDKLMSYNDILPIESFFLTKDKLKNSKMRTGGLYDKLLWEDYPIDYSNEN